MEVAIVGTGNVGGALARTLSSAGHDVIVTSTSAGEAEALAKEVGGRSLESNVDAIRAAEARAGEERLRGDRSLARRRPNGTYAKLRSRVVGVAGIRDRDGDGLNDAVYRAAFPRPSRWGTYRITARFLGTPTRGSSSRQVTFRIPRQDVASEPGAAFGRADPAGSRHRRRWTAGQGHDPQSPGRTR
jgi:F420-dependent NADP oxidoreductase-like protein